MALTLPAIWHLSGRCRDFRPKSCVAPSSAALSLCPLDFPSGLWWRCCGSTRSTSRPPPQTPSEHTNSPGYVGPLKRAAQLSPGTVYLSLGSARSLWQAGTTPGAPCGGRKTYRQPGSCRRYRAAARPARPVSGAALGLLSIRGPALAVAEPTASLPRGGGGAPAGRCYPTPAPPHSRHAPRGT